MLVAQSCLTLGNSMDCSLDRLFCPWNLPSKNIPVQVRCMRQGARGWCTGMTRGVGWGGRWQGGSGWGTHVHPWLIHVNVWQKPLQYCKVISLQLNTFILKKKRKNIGVGSHSCQDQVNESDHFSPSLLAISTVQTTIGFSLQSSNSFPLSVPSLSQSITYTVASVTKENLILFLLLVYFLLKDNCFIEFCCFLSNLNMNQLQVYIYPLPLDLSPLSHPIPPLQVDPEPLIEFPEPYSKFPLAIHFTHGNVSFHVILSIHLTLSSSLPLSP